MDVIYLLFEDYLIGPSFEENLRGGRLVKIRT